MSPDDRVAKLHQHTVRGDASRRIWNDANGKALMEAFSISGMACFLWELREAMRSLMGLGKRGRLRVDRPAITG
jgi:hypothetical protein